MRYKPGSTLFGVPVVRLRDFVALVHGSEWAPAVLGRAVKLSPSRLTAVLQALITQGWVAASNNPGSPGLYVITRAGYLFSLAAVSHGLSRAAAQTLVRNFLTRVEAVNTDSPFAMRVARVDVFGSYSTEQQFLSDVDLVIDLVPRYSDRQQQRRCARDRVRKGRASGRAIPTYWDRLFWPQTEVLAFLKARHFQLHFHSPLDRLLLSDTSFTTIYSR